MKKFICWTHLVRELLLLLVAILKATEAVYEFVNKVVNCNARKLQIHLPAQGQAHLCAQ